MQLQKNSIKVLLIDDESQSRDTLRALIQNYCSNIEIIGEADSVLFGEKLILEKSPDAIFLDIQMKDGTGFDLLNKIPNHYFQTIFITAFDEFAIRAFKINAIDYLLKPIDVDELLRVVEKMIQTKRKGDFEEQISNLLEINKTRKINKIAVPSYEGLHFLELDEIIRLESEANYTTFHILTGKPLTVAKTLKSYEQLLLDYHFFRPHQSHLINIKHVKKVLRKDGGYILMEDDCQIPISRSKKDLFISKLKDWFI